jgi:hypothetical protein
MSIRSPAAAETWPRHVVELGAHPSDVAPPWAEHVQGITHGPGVVYITQADGVWRFPMEPDLSAFHADHPSVRHVPIPEAGIDHLGDCDWSDGLLYVAVEGPSVTAICVFDRALRYLGSAPLDQGNDAPWCAIGPADGLLYSSPFDTDRLWVYARRGSPQSGTFALERVGDIALLGEDGERLRLRRVQGGAFSPRGHMYLTDDTPDGGIIGIDAATGQRRLHVAIPYEPGWPEHEVIEGLTVVDLGDGRVPWLEGQLHVLVFNADRERPDLVWLRHFDAGPDRERV